MHWVFLFFSFVWVVQVLVFKHIHVPELPEYHHHHFGYFRRKLRQHFRLPNDNIPGTDQHPARCIRVTTPTRLRSNFELIHCQELPLHTIPGESRVPRCPDFPAICSCDGCKFWKCQPWLRQAQLARAFFQVRFHRGFGIKSCKWRIVVGGWDHHPSHRSELSEAQYF